MSHQSLSDLVRATLLLSSHLYRLQTIPNVPSKVLSSIYLSQLHPYSAILCASFIQEIVTNLGK